MKRFRVAIERTYKDVSVQYVTADSPTAARKQAEDLARYEDDPREFSAMVALNVIECDEEE